MTEYTVEEIIDGIIYDHLYDWNSGYKLKEDLPYLSEVITKDILKGIERIGYKVVKK